MGYEGLIATPQIAMNRCLLTLLLCLLSLCAKADCPTKRPISLAYFELGLFYQNGRGLDPDLVEELRRRSGCTFKTVLQPRARTWAEIEAGTLDMTVSGIQTAERDRFAWFAPYIQQKNMAIVLKSLPTSIKSMEAFIAGPADWRWGAVRSFRHGSYYDPLVADLKSRGRVDEVAGTPQLFAMLAAQRFTGMFALPMVYRAELTNPAQLEKVRIEDWKPGEPAVAHGLVLSKALFTQKEARYWQDLIRDMYRDGTMSRLINRYLPPQDAARAQLPQ